MSMNYSTGTKTVERILRLAYGYFSIGTAFTDSLGTSDIRSYIEDGERFINSMLEDTVSAIPVSPVPNSLQFASDYMGAYLTHSGIFSANKPNEESPIVLSWREMAEKAIEMYKKGYMTGDAAIAGKLSYTPIFKQRGVEGIGDGILTDAKDIKTNRYK